MLKTDNLVDGIFALKTTPLATFKSKVEHVASARDLVKLSTHPEHSPCNFKTIKVHAVSADPVKLSVCQCWRPWRE